MGDSYLFNDVSWSRLEQSQKLKLRNTIASASSQRILCTSLDDLCDYFDAEFRLEIPELQKEQIIADQSEKDIDVTNDSRRVWRSPGRHLVRGTEISITVPFSGEKDLFQVQPTRYTLSCPRAEVMSGLLIIRISGTQLDPKNVKQQLDSIIGEIESYLSNLRSDVENYNASIRTLVRQQLENRKAKLLRDQNLVAELGFPLRKRDGSASTYPAPQVRRKLKPSLPQESTQPFKPEPVLASEDYEHILNVLQGMAEVMERSPSAFKTIDEESLRSHFLVQLNGQYEGQATGETFNYSGKTDILLRVDGRNIFIAECKYWSGPKKLTETLDQLLSYSCWRDTKVALIIFNRRKNFSAVLEAIYPTIEAHPNHKRTLPCAGETRFRFVLRNRDDAAREIILTVLAFDVPTETEGTPL